DYRAVIAGRQPAARTGRRLPDTPTEAAWDPQLGAALRAAGVPVEEELVLDELLADLTPHGHREGPTRV
ncbi:DUF2399 domain-containing protein, partial [Micromonospora sp. NPDC000207]|uniref:DUF2399 domain-containing protein n=1 Tax=Micromonospora sp. NPDC000207 TaxID=3154246 RepID=UPI0033186FF5